MPNILYVQPIFVPDQMRLDRNKNSIESFGRYIKSQGTGNIPLVVLMGGWARTDALWDEIVKCCKENISETFSPIRFDKNFGKAVVVNNLVKAAQNAQAAYDYILTADSDMLFAPEVKMLFIRLLGAANQVTETKKIPFGYISLNQKGAGCHWPVCYENIITYTATIGDMVFNEKMVWPKNPSGMAGGCLFISRVAWEAVNGYRVLGCYAGDDAYFLVDIATKGFSYQMSDSIYVVHPPEDDVEFAKWKVKVCSRDSHTGSKANLDAQIKEADDFWNSRH